MFSGVKIATLAWNEILFFQTIFNTLKFWNLFLKRLVGLNWQKFYLMMKSLTKTRKYFVLLIC